MSRFRSLFAFCAAALSGGAIGYGLAPHAPPPDAVAPAPMDQAGSAPSGSSSPVAFDTLSASAPTLERPTATWTLHSEVNSFTNLTDVYLSVPSDDPLACGPRRRATLMLRCLEDRTAAYISHDCNTPADATGEWPVDLQIGAAPMTSTTMEVDTRGEALGHWQYRTAREFIESLLPAKTLNVRFTDAEGIVVRMKFPVAGLSQPLDALKSACGWSEVPPWGGGPVAPMQPAPPAPPPAIVAAPPRGDPTTSPGGTTELTQASAPVFVPPPTTAPGPVGERLLLGERWLRNPPRNNPPTR